MEHIDIGNLRCQIAQASSDRICYILFGPLDETWVRQAAIDYDATLVVISGMDWDNDLTPGRLRAHRLARRTSVDLLRSLSGFWKMR